MSIRWSLVVMSVLLLLVLVLLALLVALLVLLAGSADLLPTRLDQNHRRRHGLQQFLLLPLLLALPLPASPPSLALGLFELLSRVLLLLRLRPHRCLIVSVGVASCFGLEHTCLVVVV